MFVFTTTTTLATATTVCQCTLFTFALKVNNYFANKKSKFFFFALCIGNATTLEVFGADHFNSPFVHTSGTNMHFSIGGACPLLQVGDSMKKPLSRISTHDVIS
jgi:hypothetical protein